MQSQSRFLAKTAAIALAAAIWYAPPAPSGAQEISADHLAAAREAVNTSSSTRTLDGILPGVGEQLKQRLIANRPDAADQIAGIVDEATLAMAARRANLEDEVARIYARIFTADELKQITEFYKTDAGQKLIRETPVIARSMEEAARVWAAGVQRDLTQEVQKKITEAGLQ
jgi:uncharacterized protein